MSAPRPARRDAPAGERDVPQFSIVTVCLNSAATVADSARSVREQTGVSLEHVIKDGGSTDGTLAILSGINPEARIVTSPDAGIYDAMNQGFGACRGEIVGFLNSDDYYAAPDVLQSVRQVFQETGCAVVYGDISIVDASGRVIRHWRSGSIAPGSLNGRQLPHPAVFVRRDVLENLAAPFDASYRISADLKQQLMLIEKLGAHAEYLPRVTTVMRAGGASSARLGAFVRGWAECARAYREVHGRSGWPFVLRKVLAKLPQVRVQRRAAGAGPSSRRLGEADR